MPWYDSFLNLLAASLLSSQPSLARLGRARTPIPTTHSTAARRGPPLHNRGGDGAEAAFPYLPAAAAPVPPLSAGGNTSGFGTLSPISRTFDSNSLMLMPDSVSNSAGTCAAILVMSPVTLLMPAASPFPVETIVILSTFASG